MTTSTRKKFTLAALLLEAETSDWREEDATEFLWDQGIKLISHSRQSIIRQAWAAGWCPAD
jgi:hypothetical protein